MDKNVLPTFLIIGANKSGTTSLHAYLDQHPDVFMCTPKEPMFFNTWGMNAEQVAERKKTTPYVFETVEKYQELFEPGRDKKARGESSTSYLANKTVASKIHSLIPEVKIIAILRNPVDRAFSNYLMYVRWGMEKLRFEQAVAEEQNNGRPSVPQGMHYLALGKYSSSLQMYYDLFPKEQIRIYLYDDFNKDPGAVIKDLFGFLGIDTTFAPDTKKWKNVNSFKRFGDGHFVDQTLEVADKILRRLKLKRMSKSLSKVRYHKPRISPAMQAQLKAYYAEEISALEKLIGKDLSRWR